MDKIKKYLPWLLYGGLGLFKFILWAIPYFKSFVKGGEWLVGDWTVRFSGYKVLRLWGGGFGGAMSALSQLFLLFTFIALIGVGVLGLLNRLNVTKIKEEYGKFTLDKIGTYLLYLYAGLNVLLTIFLIIYAASNSNEFGGAGISAGVFITLVFAIGAVVFRIFLQKKYPNGTDDAPQMATAEPSNAETPKNDE